MLTTAATQPYHQSPFAVQHSQQPLKASSISSAKFNSMGKQSHSQTPSFKVVHQAGKPMSANSASHPSLTFNGKENVESTTSGSGSSPLSQKTISEVSDKRQPRCQRLEEQEIPCS